MKILELPFNPDCKLKYYSKSDKLDMLLNDTNAGYILKNKLYNL